MYIPRVEVRARSCEMRAAVTVFRGIAHNCYNAPNTRSCGILLRAMDMHCLVLLRWECSGGVRAIPSK